MRACSSLPEHFHVGFVSMHGDGDGDDDDDARANLAKRRIGWVSHWVRARLCIDGVRVGVCMRGRG